jgi:hypothetical protein
MLVLLCRMQQLCYTNSWHSPFTSLHTVMVSRNEASNLVQEGHTAIQPTIAEENRSNGSGPLVCRSPTLVDKLPQTFIHKTSDFHFHRLVGTPEEVLTNPWTCTY